MLNIFKKSDKATDPICLMKIPKDAAKFKQTFEGKMYYFCSENCQSEFKKNPKNYVD